jgi:hypothetical protein
VIALTIGAAALRVLGSPGEERLVSAQRLNQVIFAARRDAGDGALMGFVPAGRGSTAGRQSNLTGRVVSLHAATAQPLKETAIFRKDLLTSPLSTVPVDKSVSRSPKAACNPRDARIFWCLPKVCAPTKPLNLQLGSGGIKLPC